MVEKHKHDIIYFNTNSLLAREKQVRLKAALATQYLHNIVILTGTRFDYALQDSHLYDCKQHKIYREDRPNGGIMVFVPTCLYAERNVLKNDGKIVHALSFNVDIYGKSTPINIVVLHRHKRADNKEIENILSDIISDSAQPRQRETVYDTADNKSIIIFNDICDTVTQRSDEVMQKLVSTEFCNIEIVNCTSSDICERLVDSRMCTYERTESEEKLIRCVDNIERVQAALSCEWIVCSLKTRNRFRCKSDNIEFWKSILLYLMYACLLLCCLSVLVLVNFILNEYIYLIFIIIYILLLYIIYIIII